MRRTDLLVEIGGSAVQRFGSVVAKTSRAEDIGYTAVRASTASVIGTTGLMWAADNAPRVGGSSDLYLLFERATTNLVPDSRVGQWAWTGTTGEGSSITPNQTAPDGTASAVLAVDSSTASRRAINSDTFTQSTAQTFQSGFFRRSSTGANPVLVLRATTASAIRGQAFITWNSTGGIASVSYTDGATAIAGSSLGELVGGGWYRVGFSSTAAVGGQVSRLEMLPAGSAASQQGGSYLWGPQVEALHYTSFVGGTTAAASNRAADSFYVDHNHPPQESTFYVRMTEHGTIRVPNGGLLLVGSSASATRRIEIKRQSGTQMYHAVIGNNVDANVQANQSVGTALGETVELNLQVASDGGLTFSQSRNSAAETTVTGTAPPAGLPATWSGQRIYLAGGALQADGINKIHSVKVARGIRSMAEMRSV